MNLGSLATGRRNQKTENVAATDTRLAQIESFEISAASVLAEDDVLITGG